MKDIIFYPLMGVIALTMIGSAMFFGWSQPKCGPFGGADGPADYSLIILSGRDLCRMEATFGYELELNGDVLTIRAEDGAGLSNVEQNAHFRLGPDLETVYAGQKVRISLTVKPDMTQADADAVWAEHGQDIVLLNNLVHLKILTLPVPLHNQTLTPRQREALEWVGDGKTMQDIAQIMGLTQATIEKHLRLARETLNVETTAQAVAKAAFHNQMYIIEAAS